jgi:hypothetical protein
MRVFRPKLYFGVTGRKICTSQFGNLRKEQALVQASSINVDYCIANYMPSSLLSPDPSQTALCVDLGPF